MDTNQKDALTDVVANLQTMANAVENKPTGTVVTPDGTIVTLGEKPGHNAVISPLKKA